MHWRSTAGERWSEPPRLIALKEPLTPTRPGLLVSWRSVVAVAGARAVGDAAARAAADRPPPLEEVRREALEEHQRARERGHGECRCELKGGHASHPPDSLRHRARDTAGAHACGCEAGTRAYPS